MPNWCNNFLEISGSKKNVSLINMKIDSMREPVLDEQGETITPGDKLFETLVGLGLEEKGMTRAEYENERWYEHNIERFGTKWDPSQGHFDHYGFEIDGDEATLLLQITTAWDSCYPFAKLLSKRYGLKIDMLSEEGGNNFYYKIEIEDGEITSFNDYTYDEGHYHNDEEYFWESIVENAYENLWSEETENPHQVLRDEFKYVSKIDMDEILRLYDEYVIEENARAEERKKEQEEKKKQKEEC